MHEAIRKMLAKYDLRTLDSHLRALREIMQELALLGLWRAKFFDKAAFYGGTALRILHGLDRFSEDLDFTLLTPTPNFDLAQHIAALGGELAAFGFDTRVEEIAKAGDTAIRSAFLKSQTRRHLLEIEAGDAMSRSVPAGMLIKVKLEVDTDPPAGFETETRYLLSPLPFPVRVCCLPDLFAGKLHAVMFRPW